MKRWFSPETFTVSGATVQMHVGGAFDVCMRSPTGEEHWIRGTFVEVAPTRLAIDMDVTGVPGVPASGCFAPIPRSTFPPRLAVRNDTLIDPSMASMVAGAPEGWRTTFDELANSATTRKMLFAQKPLILLDLYKSNTSSEPSEPS